MSCNALNSSTIYPLPPGFGLAAHETVQWTEWIMGMQGADRHALNAPRYSDAQDEVEHRDGIMTTVKKPAPWLIRVLRVSAGYGAGYA